MAPEALHQLLCRDLGLLQQGLTYQAVGLMLKVGCQLPLHVKLRPFQKDQSESAVGQIFTDRLLPGHFPFPRES